MFNQMRGLYIARLRDAAREQIAHKIINVAAVGLDR